MLTLDADTEGVFRLFGAASVAPEEPWSADDGISVTFTFTFTTEDAPLPDAEETSEPAPEPTSGPGLESAPEPDLPRQTDWPFEEDEVTALEPEEKSVEAEL